MKIKVILAVILVVALIGVGYYQYTHRSGMFKNQIVNSPLPPKTDISVFDPSTQQISWSVGGVSSSNPDTDITAQGIVLVKGKTVSLGMIKGACLPANTFNNGKLTEGATEGIVCFPKKENAGVAFGVFKNGGGFQVKKANATKTSEKTVTYGSFKTIETVQ